MKALRFVAIFAFAFSPVISAQAEWLWTRQVVSGVGTIRTITYGNGIFVAGTNTGYLLSSRDAVTWTTVRPTTSSINDVVFGSGRFVASTDSGAGSKILQSTNGTTWTYAHRVANNKTFISPNSLSVLGTKNGRFIALGPHQAAFASSTNGTRWQNPLQGGRPENYIGSVTGLTTSGDYVLCSTQAGATIQTSSDGTEWTTRFTNSSRGPARGISDQKPGRRMVCVGENGLCLASGNDGVTWKAQPFGSVDFLGVASTRALFVSFADKAVYSTQAGTTWTRQLRITRNGDHLRAIVCGAGLYLAVGNNAKNGLILVSSGLPGPVNGP